MLLLAGAFALTSCSDDNDSNPTLTTPGEFVLNQPTITGAIDLDRSSTVDFSWSQPRAYNNYDTPVVPTYTLQISPTASFNHEFDANAEDNTGADFISLEETYSSGKNVSVVAETINRSCSGMSRVFLLCSTSLYALNLPYAMPVSASMVSSTRTWFR